MDDQPTGGSNDQSRARSGMGRPGDRLLNFSWMAIMVPFLALILMIDLLLGPDSPWLAVVTYPTMVLIFALTIARIVIRRSRARDLDGARPDSPTDQPHRSPPPRRLYGWMLLANLILAVIAAAVGFAVYGMVGLIVALVLTGIPAGGPFSLTFVWKGPVSKAEQEPRR